MQEVADSFGGLSVEFTSEVILALAAISTMGVGNWSAEVTLNEAGERFKVVLVITVPDHGSLLLGSQLGHEGISVVLGDPELTEKGECLTSQALADACENQLSEEDRQDLAAMPYDEALGYAFTLLTVNGVEDPEAFLKEKGILEQGK